MIAEPPLDGGQVTDLTELVFRRAIKKQGADIPEASA